jgi:hypothetical protein
MSALFLPCWIMPAGYWAKHRDCDPHEAITPRNPRVQPCPASENQDLCLVRPLGRCGGLGKAGPV